MKKIFLIISFFTISQIALATPARVILIRHAEKPTDEKSPDLSPKGYERAQALANIFALQPDLASKGLPVALFASKYVTGQSSDRPIETLEPLSQKLNMPIQSPYLPEDEASLASLILTSPDFNGKTVMIAWKHTHIPPLAKDLGSAPADKWHGDAFDRIWLIDYDANGIATSKDIPEGLLPGDSH